MRKSIAAIAIVTLTVTLIAPVTSAASRPQRQTATAKAANDPDQPKDIGSVIRRIVRKLVPIGTEQPQPQPIAPIIPTP